MLSAYSMTELNAAIKKQKPRKASGKDGMPTHMIKKLEHSELDILKLLLINQIVEQREISRPM